MSDTIKEMIPTKTEISLKSKVLFVSVNIRFLGKVKGDLLQLLPHLDCCNLLKGQLCLWKWVLAWQLTHSHGVSRSSPCKNSPLARFQGKPSP